MSGEAKWLIAVVTSVVLHGLLPVLIWFAVIISRLVPRPPPRHAKIEFTLVTPPVVRALEPVAPEPVAVTPAKRKAGERRRGAGELAPGRTHGVLAILGSANGSEGGGAIANVFGEVNEDDIAGALSGIGGVGLGGLGGLGPPERTAEPGIGAGVVGAGAGGSESGGTAGATDADGSDRSDGAQVSRACWVAVRNELGRRARTETPRAIRERERHSDAVVVLSIRLTPGAPPEVTIVKSSGNDTYDEAAVALAEKPFPGECEGIGRWSVRF